MKIGDRIAIMKDGVVEQIGTAEDILTGPATPYVEALCNVDRKKVLLRLNLSCLKDDASSNCQRWTDGIYP
jgi:glycine betaine/proline transport system ATP-binding protein